MLCIHSECIWQTKYFIWPIDNQILGGLSPPYQKVGGAQAPPPPRFSASDDEQSVFFYNFPRITVAVYFTYFESIIALAGHVVCMKRLY